MLWKILQEKAENFNQRHSLTSALDGAINDVDTRARQERRSNENRQTLLEARLEDISRRADATAKKKPTPTQDKQSKYELKRLSSIIETLKARLLNATASSDRAERALSRAADTERQKSKMQSKAMAGDMELAASDNQDSSAAAMNAAAAGTHKVNVSFTLRTAGGETHTWASFAPKLATSEAVADADVGIPKLEVYGHPPVALAGTWTWNGTTTVTSDDTSQVSVGDAIRMDQDWFEITAIDPDVSVTIADPHSYTIPSGAGGDFGPLPRFAEGSMALVAVIDTDAGATKTHAAAESHGVQCNVNASDTLMGYSVASKTHTIDTIA